MVSTRPFHLFGWVVRLSVWEPKAWLWRVNIARSLFVLDAGPLLIESWVRRRANG